MLVANENAQKGTTKHAAFNVKLDHRSPFRQIRPFANTPSNRATEHSSATKSHLSYRNLLDSPNLSPLITRRKKEPRFAHSASSIRSSKLESDGNSVSFGQSISFINDELSINGPAISIGAAKETSCPELHDQGDRDHDGRSGTTYLEDNIERDLDSDDPFGLKAAEIAIGKRRGVHHHSVGSPMKSRKVLVVPRGNGKAKKKGAEDQMGGTDEDVGSLGSSSPLAPGQIKERFYSVKEELAKIKKSALLAESKKDGSLIKKRSAMRKRRKAALNDFEGADEVCHSSETSDADIKVSKKPNRPAAPMRCKLRVVSQDYNGSVEKRKKFFEKLEHKQLKVHYGDPIG